MPAAGGAQERAQVARPRRGVGLEGQLEGGVRARCPCESAGGSRHSAISAGSNPLRARRVDLQRAPRRHGTSIPPARHRRLTVGGHGLFVQAGPGARRRCKMARWLRANEEKSAALRVARSPRCPHRRGSRGSTDRCRSTWNGRPPGRRRSRSGHHRRRKNPSSRQTGFRRRTSQSACPEVDSYR